MNGLNIGCGTHYADGYLNIDVVRNDDTHPDEVVPRGPLPYPDASFDRAYCGHLLEHIDWGQPLLDFLADVKRILVPGGQIMCVGPDVERTLQMWKQDRIPWGHMLAVLEHAPSPADLNGDWPEARHHWNCTQGRVVMALEHAGFQQIDPSDDVGDWPAVGFSADWQFAVSAVK